MIPKSSNIRVLAFIIISLVCCISFASQSWGSGVPIGIPDPMAYFDGFDPINSPAPSVSEDGSCSRCPNWPTAENPGCYFIDKTDPNATDTNNPYGYPDKPRLTPPEGRLEAGDFVYFNAGTYTSVDSKGDRFDWSGLGTAANPIWIVGNPVNNPTIQDYIHIGMNYATSYLILDHLKINGSNRARIDLRPTAEGVSISHVVIRNCTLTGTQSSNDGTGITIGPTGGTVPSGTSIKFTVVYNNHISNFGDKATTEQCGVYLGFNTDYTWVLNNTIHDMGADGIAGCHNANDTDKLARHYFIGGNTIYRNGENSIDLKAIQDYIISQNDLYGPYTRENGWAIVLHYGAYSVGCARGWVIFNKIHDAAGGVIITDTNESIYIIGNQIFNIYDNPAINDPLNGAAIGFRGMDGKCLIVNNTLYGYEKAGVRCNQNLDPSDNVMIENNIFAGRTSTSGYEIRVDDGEDRFTIRNNQYYYGQGPAAFYWQDGARTLDYMKSVLGQCEEGQEADPLLKAPVNDFSLQSNSPCRDRGLESQAYADFESQYGFSIRKDASGALRSQGEGWDIGAIEYVEDQEGNRAPQAPGNLRVVE